MQKEEVKALIKANGLKCWEVAEAWGMNDGNFSRKLRKPLTSDEVYKLNQTINKLKERQHA